MRCLHVGAAARSERFLSFRTRHFTRVDYLMHPRAIVGQCITTVDWNGGVVRWIRTGGCYDGLRRESGTVDQDGGCYDG